MVEAYAGFQAGIASTGPFDGAYFSLVEIATRLFLPF